MQSLQISDESDLMEDDDPFTEKLMSFEVTLQLLLAIHYSFCRCCRWWWWWCRCRCRWWWCRWWWCRWSWWCRWWWCRWWCWCRWWWCRGGGGGGVAVDVAVGVGIVVVVLVLLVFLLLVLPPFLLSISSHPYYHTPLLPLLSLTFLYSNILARRN